ncbi:hypothetical protein QWY31_00585 [Cytophagales bacterium LB-30]|uniref:Uncharacterized protein n=1 Tax=Shiella aurantiaca TaxID=3058365 RepID=A0ABT8F0J8_9BACT|nr:hypothetical protein [Shiella aurantiaca]MDN4163972.1 hypothetical protein [Shiella aurantiaca]
MRFFSILTCLLLLSGSVLAQINMDDYYEPVTKEEIKKNHLRWVLNKFTLSASTGYHYTRYASDLQGYSLRFVDSIPYLAGYSESVRVGAPGVLVQNWLTKPVFFADTLRAGDWILNGDSTQLGFAGGAHGIPINASVQIAFSRFRLGAGASFEVHLPGRMSFFTPDTSISYVTDFSRAFIKRYYGHASVKIRDYWDYSFWADVQVGVLRRGNAFSGAITSRAITFNVGAPIEYNFSEYFRLTARPFVEVKSYQVQMPELGSVQKVSNPTFGLQLGVSYNYPEIRRCPIKPCHIQMKHVHQGRMYRGQPITKKQNPKIGENHPKLFKYKWRNAKMRNPY